MTAKQVKVSRSWWNGSLRISGSNWNDVLERAGQYEDKGYFVSKPLYSTFLYACNVKMQLPKGQLEERLGGSL